MTVETAKYFKIIDEALSGIKSDSSQDDLNVAHAQVTLAAVAIDKALATNIQEQ